jgi:mRNA interferase RelE/StbE
MDEPYVIGIKPKALYQLSRLDRQVSELLLRKMLWLARNVEILQHEALKGQWSEYYRWRLGDYRIIYGLEKDERLLTIEGLGHRREVYGGD